MLLVVEYNAIGVPQKRLSILLPDSGRRLFAEVQVCKGSIVRYDKVFSNMKTSFWWISLQDVW